MFTRTKSTDFAHTYMIGANDIRMYFDVDRMNLDFSAYQELERDLSQTELNDLSKVLVTACTSNRGRKYAHEKEMSYAALHMHSDKGRILRKAYDDVLNARSAIILYGVLKSILESLAYAQCIKDNVTGYTVDLERFEDATKPIPPVNTTKRAEQGTEQGLTPVTEDSTSKQSQSITNGVLVKHKRVRYLPSIVIGKVMHLGEPITVLACNGLTVVPLSQLSPDITMRLNGKHQLTTLHNGLIQQAVTYEGIEYYLEIKKHCSKYALNRFLQNELLKRMGIMSQFAEDSTGRKTTRKARGKRTVKAMAIAFLATLGLSGCDRINSHLSDIQISKADIRQAIQQTAAIQAAPYTILSDFDNELLPHVIKEPDNTEHNKED